MVNGPPPVRTGARDTVCRSPAQASAFSASTTVRICGVMARPWYTVGCPSMVHDHPSGQQAYRVRTAGVQSPDSVQTSGVTMQDRRHKPAELRRGVRIQVRLTRAENEEIERRADAAQVSVSEYVRRAVLGDR